MPNIFSCAKSSVILNKDPGLANYN